MNIIVEQTKQKIARIKDTATERSYYPILCDFFQDFAKSDAIELRDAHATPEETTTQYEKKIGFPDITIRNKNDLIGWIEVKTPEENLGADKFHDQFTKYRESLENIIFTNLREWQLWQWEDGESKQVGKTIVFDLTTPNGASEEDFEQLLVRFFEGRAYQTRTPKQLALALAKKTRLLSKQVEEALEAADEKSDLWKLKETFEKTLIQDISSHQFANMVAETMAYSLFLSALEHDRRGNGTELTLTNAIDYLPTNVPVLADLYGLIKKVASSIPNIYESAQLLVDQLNASEIERIRQKLVEHKPGEDPVIQFYEPFLAEYDPKEREARGVYYTPKPVVDYIVRSVDWILRNKFSKEKGLADESVNLLDPATGTGTFLMSAIQEIYWNTRKANEALGDEMVSREFNKIVLNHILKHFYGFELLIAPYAVAHLKLTLEIERLGFDFKLTKGDGDTENDRFKVYLANTLDDPNKPPQKLFGFDSIPAESEKAQMVKRDAPILVVLGNPPYSGISQNAVEVITLESLKNGKTRKKKTRTWIGDLIEDYKYTEGNRVTGEYFKEKKHWLGDDYVKFIRFGQWKIEQNGEGVLAFVTNHSYLDNPTFRGMRWQLMNTFDEIYVLNLHGNSKTEKTAPDGSKDENVFSIQQGVAITLLYKSPNKHNGHCKIHYSDLWGLKTDKYNFLLEHSPDSIKWTEIIPATPHYFFVPKSEIGINELSENTKITQIFPVNVTGVVTARDEFVIDFEKQKLIERIQEFCDFTNSDDYIREKYFGGKRSAKYLSGDTRGWKLSEARRNIKNEKHIGNVKRILYRPFDVRSIYYHPKMVDWGRETIVQHFFAGPNLGLCFMRQVSLGEAYSHFLVTKDMIDNRTFKSVRGIIQLPPLYLYEKETEQASLGGFGSKKRRPNIAPDFIAEFSRAVNLRFVEDGRGDLEKTFGPEDIFYYAYAIFHSPTYRSRYAEQLKIDFPRLPITSDKELFKRLVMLGNELVNLHLLGENPFDSSKTTLDDSNKWNIKIGGTAPANLDEWKVTDVRYDAKEKRVYVNAGQYFEGLEKEVWEFMIGGYQVCEKWLKDRKKAERVLSTDDLKHYMKIVVALRETIRIMSEIDKAIPAWPMK